MKNLSADITFVLQGAIDFTIYKDSFVTLELIKSIRRYFKSSRIILSTWEGSEIVHFKGIDNLEIILNVDPGPIVVEDSKPNNFNRMVHSTLSGLKKTNSKFVCKLRTDILIDSGVMLDVYQKHSKFNYDSKYRFVNNYIMTISYSSVNPYTSKSKLLFHPCDWFFLGELSDVLPFFEDIVLEHEDACYLMKHNIAISDLNYLSRLRAEQMIFTNFLKHRGVQLDFEVYNKYTEEMMNYSMKLIANNLIIVDGKMIGLYSLKHPNISRFTPTKINYLDWNLMRLKYISKSRIFANIGIYFVRCYCLMLNVGKQVIDMARE